MDEQLRYRSQLHSRTNLKRVLGANLTITPSQDTKLTTAIKGSGTTTMTNKSLILDPPSLKINQRKLVQMMSAAKFGMTHSKSISRIDGNGSFEIDSSSLMIEGNTLNQLAGLKHQMNNTNSAGAISSMNTYIVPKPSGLGQGAPHANLNESPQQISSFINSQKWYTNSKPRHHRMASESALRSTTQGRNTTPARKHNNNDLPSYPDVSPSKHAQPFEENLSLPEKPETNEFKPVGIMTRLLAWENAGTRQRPKSRDVSAHLQVFTKVREGFGTSSSPLRRATTSHFISRGERPRTKDCGLGYGGYIKREEHPPMISKLDLDHLGNSITKRSTGLRMSSSTRRRQSPTREKPLQVLALDNSTIQGHQTNNLISFMATNGPLNGADSHVTGLGNSKLRKGPQGRSEKVLMFDGWLGEALNKTDELVEKNETEESYVMQPPHIFIEQLKPKPFVQAGLPGSFDPLVTQNPDVKKHAPTNKRFYEMEDRDLDNTEAALQKARKKIDRYVTDKHSEHEVPVKAANQQAKVDERHIQLLRADLQKLSQFDIDIIAKEFNKYGEDKFDIDRVDRITKNLRFFGRYPENVRREILLKSTYKCYENGTIIFREGDKGDVFYVILRGACHVRIKKKGAKSDEDTVVVNCLYDGVQFGELALMNMIKPGEPAKNGQNLRTATIETIETTHLLSIPREDFRLILQSQIQSELDVKLKVLLSIACLEGFPTLQLIPFANNLTHRTYRYGEVILAAGSELQELLIVGDGRVKAVVIRNDVRAKRSWEYSKRRKDSVGKRVLTRTEDPELRNEVPPKTFHNEVVRELKDEIAYVSHIDLGTYQKGTILTGRVILPELTDGFQQYRLRAKDPRKPISVTLVADSPAVEMYVLDKQSISYIPEVLQRVLRDAVMEMPEVDDIRVDEVFRAEEKWKQFKKKILPPKTSIPL